MGIPSLIPPARRLVEQARREGRAVTFHVSKVQARRWNWVLTMHYVSTDPETGEETRQKVFLQTSRDRETLEALRAHLASQFQAQ